MSRSKAWRSAKIGDICTQVRGVSYDKNAISTTPLPNYYSLLRANNVGQSGSPILEDVIYVPEEFVSEKQVLKDNDILIVASSGSLESVGRAASISGLHNYTFGAFCKVIRPISDTIHPRYLHHYFQRPEYRNTISSLAEGANINNLKKEHLDNLDIALPPLSEQKRIAAILDSADAIRQKRKAAIAKLDDLAQSVFLEMFGDPVKNEKGWNDSSTLGELSEIVSGITKGRKPNGDSMKEVPYLAVSNVQDQHLDLSLVKLIEATDEEIAKYRLIRNDLLLTEGGDPDKLGRGTIWANEIAECIHQNHIFRVRISDPSRLNPVFLEWLIGSARGKQYFLRSAKQTTGIASINMGQLKCFPLLIPPIRRQNEFASRLSKIKSVSTIMEAAFVCELRLFSALQHRAFTGDL